MSFKRSANFLLWHCNFVLYGLSLWGQPPRGGGGFTCIRLEPNPDLFLALLVSNGLIPEHCVNQGRCYPHGCHVLCCHLPAHCFTHFSGLSTRRYWQQTCQRSLGHSHR